MDPNATLDAWRTARATGRPRAASWYASVLVEWLDNGGFAPQWRIPTRTSPSDGGASMAVPTHNPKENTHHARP
jgi:hypothetical protein